MTKRFLPVQVIIALLLWTCQSQAPSTQATPTDLSPTADQPAAISYALTASAIPDDAGIVSPSGGEYEEGDNVTVTANPAQGYALDHWSGDISGSSETITVNMDSDKEVTAHFVRVPVLVQFNVGTRLYAVSGTGNLLMDFDSDGDLDLILNQFDWPPPQDSRPILAFRNDGSGNFTEASEEVFAGQVVESVSARHWTVEDFNGDGLEDLFIADQGQDHPPFPGAQNLLLIQNDQGQLIDETTTRLPQHKAFTHNVASGDIDGDGDVDLYMSNVWGREHIGPMFYINDGQGFFASDTTRIPFFLTKLQKKFTASLLLDVDLDGDLDLVLGGHGGMLPDESFSHDAILLNDGSGFYSEAPEETLPPRMGGPEAGTVAISTADFDNDGWPDLLMSTHLGYRDPNLQLLMNNGDGTFRDESARILLDWPSYVTPNCPVEYAGALTWLWIVDSNVDGWLDILVQGDLCRHLLFESEDGERFSIVENLSDYRMYSEIFPWALVPGDVDGDDYMDVVLIYGGAHLRALDTTHQVLLRVPDSSVGPEEVPVIEPVPAKAPDVAAIVIPDSLPGELVFPTDDLAQGIPWLPWNESEIPVSSYYGFNVELPPFDNVLVRQAFAAVVDRQAIAALADSLGFASVKPATTLTPPEILGRDLYGQVGTTFNPTLAQDLLEEAGYNSGDDFPQVSLVVSMRSEPTPGAHSQIAESIAAMWRDHLGVTVEVEVIEDFGEYMNELLVDLPHVYQLMWGADHNDPDNFLYDLFHRGENYGHFRDDQFDELVTLAYKVHDPAERQWLYIQAERILTEDQQGIIPIFHWSFHSGD